MLKKKNELVPNISLNTRGRWGYVIELGTDPITDKRKQKTSFRFKTKKLATIAANDFINNYEPKNSLSKETKLTLNDSIDSAFNEFIENYSKKSNIKPSTVKTRNLTYKMISAHICDIKIKNFNLETVQLIINELTEKYAPSTINSIRVLLSLINDYLVEVNLLNNNFIEKIEVDKNKKIYADDKYTNSLDDKYLTKDELEKFVEVANMILPFRFYVAVVLLANTGMRAGELCALKWADINGNMIYIYKTFFTESGRSGEFELLTPKYPASKRKIPISDHVVELLQEWKKEQEEEKAHCKNWFDEDFVFTNMKSSGLPCVPRSINYHFTKINNYLHENNIIEKNVTPHTLRHTHVSLLAQADVPLINIKSRIGHGDGKVTEKIYLHVTKDSQIKSLELYESLF